MSEIASALFNKVLVKVLSSFLTYYMNNFSKESFKLQMLKGTFALADIGAGHPSLVSFFVFIAHPPRTIFYYFVVSGTRRGKHTISQGDDSATQLGDYQVLVR
jgi:hypothetical protein